MSTTAIRSEKGREGAKKAVTAGVVGNYVEQYDFGVYGAMAPSIAVLFFPPGPLALASTFSVYAVAFLIRPIGGAIFGRFGDRVGRRNTLAVSILMMAAATFVVGFLPTYAAVGVLAPILLLLCRVVQGIAVGGEYAGAVSFVVEYGPENRRAFWASFVSVSVWLGLLSGLTLAFFLTTYLPEDAFNTWGWRVPFLVAGPIGLIGLYLRLRIEETPEFRAVVEEQEGVESAPLKEAITHYWKPILVFIGFAATNAVASYTFVTYVPTYLQTEIGLESGPALLSTAVAVLVLTSLLPLAGLLADKIGRKPMFLISCTLFLLLTLPAFIVMGGGTTLAATLGQLIYIIPVFFITVTLTVSMPEMFPTEVRYSGSAIAFNIAFGLFGGTAPLVGNFLTGNFGPLAVAFYLMGMAVLSFFAVLFAFRDPYKTPLSEVGSLYR